MLISNLVFEDSLEMRSFMESVESMLAQEPERQHPAYQFDREISPSEWLALA